MEVTGDPDQRIGVAWGSVSMTRTTHRSARRSSGNTRTLPGRSPNPDSIAGILSMVCVVVFPFRRITRALQPHASTTTDAIRAPDNPIDSAISGQASRVRSTRTRARRRRCTHHGTPPITIPSMAIVGSGEVVGP